jgi:hypothetical protein
MPILVELSRAIASDLDIDPPCETSCRADLVDWIQEKLSGMRRRPEMMN